MQIHHLRIHIDLARFHLVSPEVFRSVENFWPVENSFLSVKNFLGSWEFYCWSRIFWPVKNSFCQLRIFWVVENYFLSYSMQSLRDGYNLKALIMRCNHRNYLIESPCRPVSGQLLRMNCWFYREFAYAYSPLNCHHWTPCCLYHVIHFGGKTPATHKKFSSSLLTDQKISPPLKKLSIGQKLFDR